jgi:Fe-S cluster assembly protein SufD
MIAQALDINNLPTPKQEQWKYTNLKRALPDGLRVMTDVQPIEIKAAKNDTSNTVHDIVFTGETGTHTTPSLTLIVEDGAQMTVIERHDGSGDYWKNMVTNIAVGQNATLNHIRIQNDAVQGVNTNMVNITVDRDATYDAFTLNIGGKLTRHEIHGALNGANATLTLNGVNMLNGDQHGDTTIVIDHAAPHCASNQFYRTILDDKARGVFQGKVHVHQIAQKTDGYQLANTLLLSDTAEMDVKPELEIYADDVKCSHGATTGRLDDEPLFYMRARGIPEAEARKLLIQAFAEEVIEKINHDETADDIRGMAEAWLQSVL